MLRNRSLVLLLPLLFVALTASYCSTGGSATLKAQSVTIDGLKMTGYTVKLLEPTASTLIRAGAVPVAVADGWFVFMEGSAPLSRDANKAALRADPVGCAGGKGAVEGKCRFSRTDPVDDALCAAPAIKTVAQVYQRCGFRDTYPFLFREYETNKEVATQVASVAEAMLKQVLGFAGQMTGGK